MEVWSAEWWLSVTVSGIIVSILGAVVQKYGLEILAKVFNFFNLSIRKKKLKERKYIVRLIKNPDILMLENGKIVREMLVGLFAINLAAVFSGVTMIVGTADGANMFVYGVSSLMVLLGYFIVASNSRKAATLNKAQRKMFKKKISLK